MFEYLLYDTEFPVNTISSIHLKAITSFLKSPDQNMRGNAAHTLGRMGNHASSVIPEIIPLLGDDEFNVGKSTAEAIRMFCADAEPFVSDIATYLKDPRPNVRRVALMALGNMGEYVESAVPLIINLYKSGGIDLQKTQSTLTKMVKAVVKHIPTFELLLNDTSSDCRLLAMQLLVSMGQQVNNYTLEIAAQLSDIDSDIRGTAIRTLKKIGGNVLIENLPIIAVRLNDRSRNVYRAVCQAFEGVGDEIRPYYDPASSKRISRSIFAHCAFWMPVFTGMTQNIMPC